MKKIALILFIVSGLAVLVSELTGISWMYTIGKPLIMISLLSYYMLAAEPINRSRVLILAFDTATAVHAAAQFRRQIELCGAGSDSRRWTRGFALGPLLGGRGCLRVAHGTATANDDGAR